MSTDLIPATAMKELFPGTSDQYWSTLRHKGTGPKYIKVVRKVYYDLNEVKAWLAANVYERPDKRVTA